MATDFDSQIFWLWQGNSVSVFGKVVKYSTIKNTNEGTVRNVRKELFPPTPKPQPGLELPQLPDEEPELELPPLPDEEPEPEPIAELEGDLEPELELELSQPEPDPKKKRKKYTQSAVGKMLGWSRESVKNYAALQKICPDAWAIIGTTFEKTVPASPEGSVPADGTTVPTEGLLRLILDLEPKQQVDLVTALVTQKDFSKNKFKSLAENYKARKDAKAYGKEKLKEIGEPYVTRLCEEVDKGAYDDDWKEKPDHPKLHKLIDALIMLSGRRKTEYVSFTGIFMKRSKN